LRGKNFLLDIALYIAGREMVSDALITAPKPIGRWRTVADKGLETVLRHMRELVGVGLAAGLPDHELLARFLKCHDQAAFTAEIERHGPLVLGVCRRVLRNEQEAEDVCQATFLVLIRKAVSLVPRCGGRTLAASRPPTAGRPSRRPRGRCPG
jgi:hypothetical protein